MKTKCTLFGILLEITVPLQGELYKYSFLCPNGTLFQQVYFVCDWWFNVDCSRAEDYYYLNEELQTSREEYSKENSGKSGELKRSSLGSDKREGLRGGPSANEKRVGSTLETKNVRKKNRGSGLRRSGASQREISTASKSNPSQKTKDIDPIDLVFPDEEIESLNEPTVSINTLYDAPLEEVKSDQELIYSFEAEIPPENSRRLRDAEISNHQNSVASASIPSLLQKFVRLIESGAT